MQNKIFTFFILLILGHFFSINVRAMKDDQNQPIEISSDSAERDEKLGITLYHGHVVIKQGSVLIEAETVTIKTRLSPSSSHEEIEEIITVGSPSHMQQQLDSSGEIVDASATTIRYEVDSDTIDLIEDAILKQGARVITGGHIRYNIAAQKVIAGSESAVQTSQKRVTVTIPPKPRTDQKANP